MFGDGSDDVFLLVMEIGREVRGWIIGNMVLGFVNEKKKRFILIVLRVNLDFYWSI